MDGAGHRQSRNPLQPDRPVRSYTLSAPADGRRPSLLTPAGTCSSKQDNSQPPVVRKRDAQAYLARSGASISASVITTELNARCGDLLREVNRPPPHPRVFAALLLLAGRCARSATLMVTAFTAGSQRHARTRRAQSHPSGVGRHRVADRVLDRGGGGLEERRLLGGRGRAVPRLTVALVLLLAGPSPPASAISVRWPSRKFRAGFAIAMASSTVRATARLRRGDRVRLRPGARLRLRRRPRRDGAAARPADPAPARLQRRRRGCRTARRRRACSGRCCMWLVPRASTRAHRAQSRRGDGVGGHPAASDCSWFLTRAFGCRRPQIPVPGPSGCCLSLIRDEEPRPGRRSDHLPFRERRTPRTRPGRALVPAAPAPVGCAASLTPPAYGGLFLIHQSIFRVDPTPFRADPSGRTPAALRGVRPLRGWSAGFLRITSIRLW